MSESGTKEDAVKEAANILADAEDADIFLLNYEILPPVDFIFMGQVSKRKRRKNVILILVTEGGSADSAFRMMRFLQASYERVTVVVPGWCKSAGTLMCIGAHSILMGDSGELGPLDVQIVKADELDEQKSGLAAEAAFEKLQQEAYKFFMNFVRDIGSSEYRVTLKTASDIASKLTIGVVQPIFDKLEPVTIGEDYRSNRLAQAYAERLNTHSRNLKRDRTLDALDNLLSGYPSHGFVIDFKEASVLFRNVKPLSPVVTDVVSALGLDAVYPRSRRQEQSPKLEFLNEEREQPAGEQAAGPSGDAAAEPKRRPTPRRNGSAQLPGHIEEGSGEEPSPPQNGQTGTN